MTDEIIHEILEKLTNHQQKMSTVFIDWKRQVEEMDRDIRNLTTSVEINNDAVIHSTTVLEGMKDLVKEFSLYAATRQDLDTHLQSNIELLGNYWQESINLFTETKNLIDSIHTYSEEVSSQRTRILTVMPSKEFMGLNLYQEWLMDLMIDLIVRFCYEELTHQEVTRWMKEFHNKNLRKGYIKQPQFLTDVKEKYKWAKEVIADLKKEFKLTSVVEVSLWTAMMIFQSTANGTPFVDYPGLKKLKEKIAFLENKFYE